MTSILPPVVIDNGSSSTRAGFAHEDLPSLVFNSNYTHDPQGNVVVGDDEIAQCPSGEIMTLVEDGVVYNMDNIKYNWEYVFKSLDGGNGVDPKDHPLMLTEPTWNTNKNRTSLAQIAFEECSVPLFSLVKTPLAQLYHMGRSSGLVIDVGSSTTSVTTILDGIVQLKASLHSKYGGDFASLHCLNSIESKLGYQPHQLDYARLLPRSYSATPVSDSFKRYYTNQDFLLQFKQGMLHVAEPPAGQPATTQYAPPPHQHPPQFQLPDGTHVPFNDHDIALVTEPLFFPHMYTLPGVRIPEPVFEKPSTFGVSNLVFLALKSLESSLLSSMASDSQSSATNARINEFLRQLFGNTLITGGGSLLPGFTDRLCGDLIRKAPEYFPNYLVTGTYKLYISPLRNYPTGDMNEGLDRKFGSWLGAANLANMLKETSVDGTSNVNIALDNWFVSKAVYEELGEELIVEKFK